MTALAVDYEGRVWALDLERIDTDTMEVIENYTGRPGNSWLDELRPTDAAGVVLTPATAKDMDESELRFNPPSKIVRALFWVMLRQNGQDPGPITAANPLYGAFLLALTMGLAKAAGVTVEAVEDPIEAQLAVFDPKDKQTEPVPTPLSNGTLTVAASP